MLLEPLSESLVPVLHITFHRRPDTFQDLSKNLYRSAMIHNFFNSAFVRNDLTSIEWVRNLAKISFMWRGKGLSPEVSVPIRCLDGWLIEAP